MVGIVFLLIVFLLVALFDTLWACALGLWRVVALVCIICDGF